MLLLQVVMPELIKKEDRCGVDIPYWADTIYQISKNEVFDKPLITEDVIFDITGIALFITLKPKDVIYVRYKPVMSDGQVGPWYKTLKLIVGDDNTTEIVEL